ncbi:MAG: D-alanyl-D-alanine carboxypeptidase [Oscillospiraceae bacterium]|nr:D-alanyl-D-alanine carboxypeptidase [Oscillospiraceae bacterium]
MFGKLAKYLSVLLSLAFLLSVCASANDALSVSDYVTAPDWAVGDSAVVADASALNLGGKSILLMEETSGKVLYERDADIKMPPASITKIMTLLLTMEAMENGAFALDTQVTCSNHAASMGGAQIWLEEGEKMSVDDLIKAVCIKSANDAAVLLAELVGGSEDGFVVMMNERAAELKMTNTTFKNASGLDADGHLSTARDIAIMSRALMRHDKIFEYTKIWMDTLRGGETELVNTNKLIRFYKGATGLKTGTTDGAGSCLSATAERDGLSLIGVVMGYPDSKTRNAAAKKLLDFGFTNWKIIKPEVSGDIPESIAVKKGIVDSVKLSAGEIPSVLIERKSEGNITTEISLPDELIAPVKSGQTVGTAEIFVDGKPYATYEINAAEEAKQMTFLYAFLKILAAVF